ncbi:MAG: type I DNA topoisomerase [Deltaproteobacteria bacterium]|nr:type I DNA topoisomerase [Deltaproteobacteria bacterium]
MPNSLIIVESPAKVKTIKKYLGPDFEVRASMGHVKDLPKSKLGIDTKNNFEPTYQIIDSKKKTIADLKKAASKVRNIYLAPDPDREGEAIAWHISQEIRGKETRIQRVLFNDLTKKTILQAIENPHELDLNKYEAQQTRRILDRLVGYQISPLLWEKVKRGLSAGRVQSVAVRLICDREDEIQKFVSEEYWNITALLEGSVPPSFSARLIKTQGKKIKIRNETESNRILEELKGNSFVVSHLEKKETKRLPLPPFSTSKLQQEAARVLHFPAKKTMNIAQQLYEGIELGREGSVGLITYMRTDSVRIADEAIRDARNYILDHYGQVYLPAKSRIFRNTGKAQDAHEAIRPSSMAYPPQDIKDHLNRDQFRLYQLIWTRFLACQMNPALYDQTIIDVAAGGYLFRAQGAVMKFPGYRIVYSEGKEEDEKPNDKDFDNILPDVSEGEILHLTELRPDQKFTQPPPRFTEATLVRELEERGIGRPSTYATILSTIQERDYVKLDKGRFYPTDLGMLVTELLVRSFPKILEVAFTASMENQLDMIEEGSKNRFDTLNDFYASFQGELQRAKSDMKNVKGEGISTNLTCEKCGSPMVIKLGRNGKFLACSAYPGCKNTRNIELTDQGNILNNVENDPKVLCSICGKPMLIKSGRFGRFLGCSGYPECKNTMKIPKEGQESAATPVETFVTDRTCSQCGRPMVVKEGRFGRFLGCSGYPACKYIEQTSLGIKCPRDGCNGEISEKRSKRGKLFYGCTNYPKCHFTSWNRPVPEACPQCGYPILVEKSSPKRGTYKACPKEGCGYKSETL